MLFLTLKKSAQKLAKLNLGREVLRTYASCGKRDRKVGLNGGGLMVLPSRGSAHA